MVVQLVNRFDQKRARDLVESNGFVFEENYDVLLGIFEDGELIATAARDGNIFKMICIKPEHQGGGLLGELMTELLKSCDTGRYENYFIFTKPGTRQSFEQFNFRTLVEHPALVLLEYGRGLQNYLNRHNHLIKPGDNGAVVINANPFTLGHQFLVEQAAAQVDHLYVFVVREDRSVFPFDIRFELVKQGVEHLDNVSVLETSDYAVSSVTFPSYFLKQDDALDCLQMEVDLLLFARKIAPHFNVKKRFIGTEPLCMTTQRYCVTMDRVLVNEGVEIVQLERKEIAGEPISASRIRNLLKEGRDEEVVALAPETTSEFLLSPRGEEIRARLKNYQGRH